MTNIKIDIKALEEPIKKSNNLAESTDNLLNEFNSQKICIDNIICERDNIKYDLDKIGTEIKSISERFTKYGKQINGVINAYEYAERELNKMLMVLEPPSKKEKNDNDIKPADVTVGDVKIGNTMVSNGITTGNLIDIVKGLGGTVSWDETSKTTTVIINGKTTSYNLNNIKDGIGYASDGSTFTVKDGHIQVGIREISEKAGANVKWSPTSVGVKVDVDYTYASVSRTIKVTKDNGEAGELWVSDNIVIFEQEGSRSHVRYPVKDGYATAWIDTDKLNVCGLSNTIPNALEKIETKNNDFKSTNTEINDSLDFTYYAQNKGEWADDLYTITGNEKQTIKSSGCGPASFAMVASTLTGEKITPDVTAKYSVDNGYRTESSGTSWSFFLDSASDFNLEVETTTDIDEVKEALSDNKHMVITSVGKGHFTSGSGHFITIGDYDKKNDSFTVLDPYSYSSKYDKPGRNDGKIKTTDELGVVEADADMVSKESKDTYYIYKKKEED
ncbi:C39 family peptidase [Vallitalea guaymasensis]|uniref:C39 family peptidase n=1 Tax=Vallitalea guaymasensis TaxID=1185412 RepID=UPI0023560A5F|nr:C39 family peptidase [Vallitalea guaymasensis]